MKKTGIIGIFALLIIMAAMAACVQEPDYSDAVIKYRFYGGFVMQTHAIQELVVTQDKACLLYTSPSPRDRG